MDQNANLVVKCQARLTTDLKQQAWECDLPVNHEGPHSHEFQTTNPKSWCRVTWK